MALGLLIEAGGDAGEAADPEQPSGGAPTRSEVAEAAERAGGHAPLAEFKLGAMRAEGSKGKNGGGVSTISTRGDASPS